jgi:hypothetical protein
MGNWMERYNELFEMVKGSIDIQFSEEERLELKNYGQGDWVDYIQSVEEANDIIHDEYVANLMARMLLGIYSK